MGPFLAPASERMNLSSRLRTIPSTVLKAPHTLLKVPRQHTIAFWRGLCLLCGLSVLYVGYQEAQLRFTCLAPEDLSARELSGRRDSPIWARVDGIAPRAEVAVESTEGGSFKGIWLPLVGPEDPETVLAVLRAPDRATAASLQTGQKVTVEGLAYFPRPTEEKNLGVYLHWLHRPRSPMLRILELGRTPAGWMGIGAWLLVGLGLLALAVAVRWKTPDFGPEPAEMLETEDGEEMLVTLGGYQSEPLPEDVKVEVQEMLDDAWTHVAERR